MLNKRAVMRDETRSAAVSYNESGDKIPDDGSAEALGPCVGDGSSRGSLFC
jgi:hypothetical protein